MDHSDRGERRRVFGLAPSQIAARVLTEEGVSAAVNTTAWLGAQRRLDGGSAVDEAWRLRGGDLVVVDEEWYLDSVVTRDYAHRSASELRARGIDPYDTSDHVTGDGWLDAHRAAQTEDDKHREIHPDEIADEHDDTRTDVPDPRERQPIREVDQTAEMVARAQETLRMIEERRAAEVEQTAHEASRVAEEEARATQLTRWSQEDEQTVTDTVEVDDGQALER